MKTRLVLTIVLAGLLGAGGGIGGYLLYERHLSSAGAMTRPDFQLPDLDGRLQSVSQWDGKVLVLNFWGTWCPPCVREIPMLIELQRDYREQGLQIVGVAVDQRDAAQVFAADVGINYPILYGVQSALEVSQAYRNDAGTLPYTVVIDRQGIVRHIFPTELEREPLETILQPLL